jgi:DNA-binding transcriptional MerR regulator
VLSIGEFSNICKVSAKTLRYYAEIGLLEPSEVNPDNGYRYYAIEQLEKMLFINRLSQLFAEEDAPVSLTEAQKKLLERWSRLSEEQQAVVFALIDKM